MPHTHAPQCRHVTPNNGTYLGTALKLGRIKVEATCLIMRIRGQSCDSGKGVSAVFRGNESRPTAGVVTKSVSGTIKLGLPRPRPPF